MGRLRVGYHRFREKRIWGKNGVCRSVSHGSRWDKEVGEMVSCIGMGSGKKWEKRKKENKGLISFDGNYLLFLDTSVRKGR